MDLQSLAPSDLTFLAASAAAALACLFLGWRLSTRERTERARAEDQARRLEAADTAIAELRERLSVLAGLEAAQAGQEARLAALEDAAAGTEGTADARLDERMDAAAAEAAETVAEMVMEQARAEIARAGEELAGTLRAELVAAEAELRRAMEELRPAPAGDGDDPAAGDPAGRAAEQAEAARAAVAALQAELPDRVAAACDAALPDAIAAALPAPLEAGVAAALERIEARIAASLPARIETELERAAAPALEAFRTRLAAAARAMLPDGRPAGEDGEQEADSRPARLLGSHVGPPPPG